MKLIFSITILLLFSCKLNDKNSSHSNAEKLDFLDSQNYTEDFEIVNDWFLSSQFCKRNIETNDMIFSANIFFKYADEVKWKENKHWCKNSDYEVKIDNKRLADYDRSFLYNNFEMWSSVISHEYFINDKQSDNSCFDIAKEVTYKIYHHQPDKNEWELINETTNKKYLENLILKKGKELKNTHKKQITSLSLVELEKNDLAGEFGTNACDDSDLKLISDDTITYIDFFTQQGKGIEARILASPFIDKNSKEILFYKYRMLTGITRFNKALDWMNISQDSIIAKVTYKGNNQLELKWLGFYDKKKGKRVDLLSSSSKVLGLLNTFQLNKCREY